MSSHVSCCCFPCLVFSCLASSGLTPCIFSPPVLYPPASSPLVSSWLVLPLVLFFRASWKPLWERRRVLLGPFGKPLGAFPGPMGPSNHHKIQGLGAADPQKLWFGGSFRGRTSAKPILLGLRRLQTSVFTSGSGLELARKWPWTGVAALTNPPRPRT